VARLLAAGGDLSGREERPLLRVGEGGGAGYSVYIRKTDGSPAVRLGEGSGQDLSPDGEWVLAIVHPASDPQLVAYPTGAGESKLFPKDGVSVFSAAFLPGGKQILVTGSEAGHGPRLYVRDFAGGKPRAVSPEGYLGGLVSPDGKWATVRGPDRKRYLYPLSGGEPREIPGVRREDGTLQFSPTVAPSTSPRAARRPPRSISSTSRRGRSSCGRA
jgi:hypothetical protein